MPPPPQCVNAFTARRPLGRIDKSDNVREGSAPAVRTHISFGGGGLYGGRALVAVVVLVMCTETEFARRSYYYGHLPSGSIVAAAVVAEFGGGKKKKKNVIAVALYTAARTRAYCFAPTRQ